MKKLSFKLIATAAFVVMSLISNQSLLAQAKYQAQALNLSVKGTSTLHDWEIKTNKGHFEALIEMEHNRVNFSGLSFSLPAESLKSGHNMMDKNTYKALNTEKNPNISFVLSNANVTPSGTNTYHLRGIGKLTIAGTTKQTDVEATLKYNPTDKSFTCIGTKTFNMSEYGVKPPTVMMGTIKTGDKVSISYNLIIKS